MRRPNKREAKFLAWLEREEKRPTGATAIAGCNRATEHACFLAGWHGPSPRTPYMKLTEAGRAALVEARRHLGGGCGGGDGGST